MVWNCSDSSDSEVERHDRFRSERSALPQNKADMRTTLSDTVGRSNRGRTGSEVKDHRGICSRCDYRTDACRCRSRPSPDTADKYTRPVGRRQRSESKERHSRKRRSSREERCSTKRRSRGKSRSAERGKQDEEKNGRNKNETEEKKQRKKCKKKLKEKMREENRKKSPKHSNRTCASENSANARVTTTEPVTVKEPQITNADDFIDLYGPALPSRHQDGVGVALGEPQLMRETSDTALNPEEARFNRSSTSDPSDSCAKVTGCVKQLKRKNRLSGAAKRRIRRDQAKTRGLPVIPEKQKTTSCSSEVTKGAETKPAGEEVRACINEATPSTLVGQSVCPNSIPSTEMPAGALKMGQDGETAGPSGSYSETLQDLKVVLVPTSFPEVELTTELVDELEQIITGRVLSFPMDGSAPRFRNTYLERGAYYMVCDTPECQDWLFNLIPSISLSGDLKLRVGSPKDILYKTKVALQVSKPLHNTDPKNILHYVKTQNAGLMQDDWRIISQEMEDDRQTIVLSIGEDSLKALQSNNLRACVGLRQAIFKILPVSEPISGMCGQSADPPNISAPQ